MAIVGIEAGGTKVVVAAGTGPDDLTEPVRVPTTTPDETVARVVAVIDGLRDQRAVDGIGLATFGPVVLGEDRPDRGRIFATNKPGWSGANPVAMLERATGLPVAVETDVNAAALAEARWGAAAGATHVLYLTVGTGIGAGVLVQGRPVHGLVHPEVGHVAVQRRAGDDFAGTCRHHDDCVEGLAAGPALAARFGRRAEDLDGADRSAAVALVGDYVGQAVAAVTWVVSPQRIVIGGGVAGMPGVLQAVRTTVAARIGTGLEHPLLAGDLSDWIVPPGLGDRSGVLGALVVGATES